MRVINDVIVGRHINGTLPRRVSVRSNVAVISFAFNRSFGLGSVVALGLGLGNCVITFRGSLFAAFGRMCLCRGHTKELFDFMVIAEKAVVPDHAAKDCAKA